MPTETNKSIPQSSKKIVRSIWDAMDVKLDRFKQWVTTAIKNYRVSSNQIEPGAVVGSKIAGNAIYARHITANSISARNIQTESIEGPHLTLSARESITTSNRNLLQNSVGLVESSSFLIAEYEASEILPSTQYTFVFEGYVNENQRVVVKFNDGTFGTDSAVFDDDGYAVIRTTSPSTISNNKVRLYNSPSSTAIQGQIFWACMYKGFITSPPKDYTPSIEEINERINETQNAIGDLVTTSSSKTTIFCVGSSPTTTNVGDVWFNTDVSPRLAYRWAGSSWTDFSSTALITALTSLADADAIADGKIIVYSQASQPTSIAIGDIWRDTDDNDKTYRWNGSWFITTSDSISSALSDLIVNITNSPNEVTNVLFSSSSPIATTTGDVWVKLDDANTVTRRWSGSAWIDITTVALVQALRSAADTDALADNRISIYKKSAAPLTSEYTLNLGDLWVNTGENRKLYRWDSISWSAVRSTALDGRVSTIETNYNGITGTMTTIARQTAYTGSLPPTTPTDYASWINTGVTPPEQLRWTGNSANTARSYAASKTGAIISFNDLSNDHTLGVTVRTVAIQAGSGTPSPSNIRAISGKSSIAVRRRGKNLADPTITGVTSNGVTVSYDSANQTVTLNGTCTTNNTNFFFAVPPEQINAAHILSMYYVSGTAARVGENSLWMAEASYQNAFGVLAFPDAGRSSSSVVNAARNYVYFALRLDAGSVFTNYTFRLQLEFGSTPSDWEPYAAQAYALTPDAPLYGWGSVQDHVGTDGLAAHYMERVSLTGDEAFDDGSDLGDVVRIGLALSVAGTAGETLAISSHFPQLYSYASNTVHFYVTGSILTLFIPKTVLSTSNLTGAKAWVKAQATAGTPVQVLYQRANPVYAAVAPVAITGVDGINTVTSDGASVTVSYTGSGWEVISGKANSLYASATQKFDADGLRIDQTLVNGTTTLPTYFHAGAQDYGLYKASDGTMIAGAGVDSSGNGYFAATRLRDIDQSEDLSIKINSYTEPYDSTHDLFRQGIVFMKGDTEKGSLEVQQRIYDSEDTNLVVWAKERELHLVGSTGVQIYDGTLTNNIKLSAGTVSLDVANLIPTSNGEQTCGNSTHGFNYYYGTHTSIQSTSDERAKHDITPLDKDIMEKFITSLEPIWYRLNDAPDDLMAGFIAQRFMQAMADSGISSDFAGINDEDENHYALDYCQIIAPLVAVVQSYIAKFKEAQAKIEVQASKIESIEAQLAEIRALLPTI